jgi:hypothetical protein
MNETTRMKRHNRMKPNSNFSCQYSGNFKKRCEWNDQIKRYEWNDIMEQNQIQGFRVNIQANSNPFPDAVWKWHCFIRIVLFDRFKPFISFHSSLCHKTCLISLIRWKFVFWNDWSSIKLKINGLPDRASSLWNIIILVTFLFILVTFLFILVTFILVTFWIILVTFLIILVTFFGTYTLSP